MAYNLNKINFSNSWKSLAVFLILVLFQPHNITFFAIRFSDVYLWILLYFQIKDNTDFKKTLGEYSFIIYFGWIMGAIAVIATSLEFLYLDKPFNPSSLFSIYRWCRLSLIFWFISNIKLQEDDFTKILGLFNILLLFFVPLSLMEYFDILGVRDIIGKIYYPTFSGKVGDVYVEKSAADYVGMFDQEDFQYRAMGFAGNPNASSIFYTMTGSIAIVNIFLSKKTKDLVFSITMLIASIIPILISFGSRTSLMGIFFNGILVIALSGKLKRKTFRVVTIVLIFNIVISYLISADVIQGRIFNTIDDYNKNQDVLKTTGRDDLWSERLSTFIIMGHPLAPFIGMGYTKFIDDFADNGFLSSLTNRGAIGLVIHIILYVYVIRRIRNIKKFSILSTVPLKLLVALTSLMIFETSADMLEDYRVGQVFFIFLGIFYKSITDVKYYERT